ncbi:MAG: hypothetical protein ACM3S4_07420 [Burkholderiales bacterium]
MSEEKKTIEILDLVAKSIEFFKAESANEGAELKSVMECEYKWTSEDENKSKIEATVTFRFEPRVLYYGKMVFEAEIVNNTGKLTDEEKAGTIKAIEPRLGSICSFVTTVCGEAISAMKFIIPPYFINTLNEKTD